MAILGMFVLGGLMLGPESSGSSRGLARPSYAPGDIRYNLQQAETKKAKKKRNTPPQAPARDQFVTDGSTSSGGSDRGGSGDEAAEEPSVFDHEPQEEPPLD